VLDPLPCERPRQQRVLVVVRAHHDAPAAQRRQRLGADADHRRVIDVRPTIVICGFRTEYRGS
jgi:hypothetical protein